MRVSVIIPCYNVADSVGRTLASLQAQTFRDWEAVLVDDGSTDATPTVLAAFAQAEPRARIITQTNQRLAAARNAGLGAAHARRILFLDAGDTLEPQALAVLNDILDAHADAGAAFAGYRIVGSAGEDHNWCYEPPAERLSFPDFTRTNPVCTNSLLIDRQWIDRAGVFDGSLPACEDWDLWARIARTGCLFYGTMEPLSRYFMDRASHSRRAMLMLDAGLTVLRHVHGPDPRCLQPAPRHANGISAESLQPALSEWATYCLALAFSYGGPDAAEELLRKCNSWIEWRPHSLAHALYVALPYAQCRFPDEWPQLWTEHNETITAWLARLDAQYAPGALTDTCIVHLVELMDQAAVPARLVDEIARRGRRLRRVILYGYGRNGRTLHRLMQQKTSIEPLIVDDGQRAGAIEHFAPPAADDLIIVTPWESAAMVRRLEQAGAEHGLHYITWNDYARRRDAVTIGAV